MDIIKFNKIKEKALEEHIPIIMDDTLETIDKLFDNCHLDNILEIGTAVGYSAICFSKFLSEDGNIDTIERDEQRASEAIKNIEEMELNNKVNVFIGDAVEILPKFNKFYDMIFIDAAKGKYPFFLNEAIRMSKPRNYNYC